MDERLVDVINHYGNVIHTYPITFPKLPTPMDDALFEAKALEAARFGRLVPDNELATLHAKMHFSRSGRLEPYGDEVPVMAETRSVLMESIREQAYLLWQQGETKRQSADEDWLQARQSVLEKRAYTLWEEDGRPANRADEYWFRTQRFEAC